LGESKISGESSYPLPYKFFPIVLVIFTCFVVVIAILRRNAKIEKGFKLYREVNFSMAILFIGYAGTRIFFLLSDIGRVMSGRTILYYQLVYLGYLSSVFGFSIAIYY